MPETIRPTITISSIQTVDAGLEPLYQWLGGMPRGIRGTDLFNLILNCAYVCFEARQGDDMWLKVGNVAETLAMYADILAMGINCQPIKQLFTVLAGPGEGIHDTLGEFLRVLYLDCMVVRIDPAPPLRPVGFKTDW